MLNKIYLLPYCVYEGTQFVLCDIGRWAYITVALRQGWLDDFASPHVQTQNSIPAKLTHPCGFYDKVIKVLFTCKYVCDGIKLHNVDCLAATETNMLLVLCVCCLSECGFAVCQSVYKVILWIHIWPIHCAMRAM